MTEPPFVATRVDEHNGLIEEVAFLEVAGVDVYTVLHRPRGNPPGGVVICCPIMVELLTNYRREVLLARALACAGVAVQRFHYRGTGHSSGEESALTLESMVTDGLAILARFRQRVGLDGVAFLGTRWGALVAAELARRVPGSPLALWEPVVDGGHYFREVIRGRLVRELKDARFAGDGTNVWREELQKTGRVDILGHWLHENLFQSGQGLRLTGILEGQRAPVLLAQLGRGETLRPEYARLRDSLVSQGRTCDVLQIRDEPAWFFPGQGSRSDDMLIDKSTKWLRAPQDRGARSI